MLIIIKEGRLVVQSLVEDLLQQVPVVSGQKKDKVDRVLDTIKSSKSRVCGNKELLLLYGKNCLMKIMTLLKN